MTRSLLPIPEALRDIVSGALVQAFGATSRSVVEPVTGGASGALTYKVLHSNRAYLMRIEVQRGAFRNPHQYACMQIAAEAGIAPPVRLLDADRGLVIMDFVPGQPLEALPGGRPALVKALADLVSTLQSAELFPELYRYNTLLGRMIEVVRSSAMFKPGVLDWHFEVFRRIDEIYPWDTKARVSSHNDPNPRNILFDGHRLWLIDWETAYLNDPLTDLAILTDNFAEEESLEAALLAAWCGVAATGETCARLYLMRMLTRLYYACLLLAPVSAAPAKSGDEATAIMPVQFEAAVRNGQLRPGSPAFMQELGKLFLARFADGIQSPRFEWALAQLR